MPYYNLGGSGGSGGGGAAIDDTQFSKDTTLSGQRIIDLIMNVENRVALQSGFELPEYGSKGQRFYHIDEDVEYTFRGYDTSKNIVDKTTTSTGGETEITTPNGIVVRASSTLAGKSVANIFDGDINTSWQPEETDMNPYIEIDFGNNSYPKVLAIKFFANLELIPPDSITVSGYNIPEYKYNILKINSPSIPAETYTLTQLKDGVNSYQVYKIQFNSNIINIHDLELFTGLWVPVY